MPQFKRNLFGLVRARIDPTTMDSKNPEVRVELANVGDIVSVPIICALIVLGDIWLLADDHPSVGVKAIALGAAVMALVGLVTIERNALRWWRTALIADSESVRIESPKGVEFQLPAADLSSIERIGLTSVIRDVDGQEKFAGPGLSQSNFYRLAAVLPDHVRIDSVFVSVKRNPKRDLTIALLATPPGIVSFGAILAAARSSVTDSSTEVYWVLRWSPLLGIGGMFMIGWGLVSLYSYLAAKFPRLDVNSKPVPLIDRESLYFALLRKELRPGDSSAVGEFAYRPELRSLNWPLHAWGLGMATAAILALFWIASFLASPSPYGQLTPAQARFNVFAIAFFATILFGLLYLFWFLASLQLAKGLGYRIRIDEAGVHVLADLKSHSVDSIGTMRYSTNTLDASGKLGRQRLRLHSGSKIFLFDPSCMTRISGGR